MSRGFVREGDQEEVPLVPQRAYLPAGVPNFVTPEGMAQLTREKEALILEREGLGSSNESDRRIAQNFINAKLQLLNERISEARLVDTSANAAGEITFGATVTLLNQASGSVQTFKITGVDEADVGKGKISFISPLAKLLLNRKSGEIVTFKRNNENVIFEIIEVTYR